MAWEKQDLTAKCYETKYLYSDEAISFAGALLSEDKGLADKVEGVMQKFCDVAFLKKGITEHINEIHEFYSTNPKQDLSALVIYSAMQKDKDAKDYHEYIFVVYAVMPTDYIYKKQSKRKKYFGPVGSLLNKWMCGRDTKTAEEKMMANFSHHILGFKEIIQHIEDFQNRFNLTINRKELERLKKEKPEGFKEQQNNQ